MEEDQQQDQQQPFKIQAFDVIVMLNVVLFGIMWLVGGFKVDSEVLIKFGAKFNYNMVSGEWWRLITPMFLHVDLMHLMMNTLGVISLSQPLKHIFGLWRLLMIYFVAGVCGVVLSFAFSNSLSAGASTAIFGMLGTHVYLYLRHPMAYRHIFGTQFLTLIAINFIYGFVVQGVDNLGHLGGFIGGFIVAYSIGVKSDSLKRKQVFLMPVLCLLIVTGVIGGYTRYYKSADYYFMHFVDAVRSEQYEEAYNRLEEGLAEYPEDEKLLEVYNSLKSQ